DGSFTYDGGEQYGAGHTDDDTYFGRSSYCGLGPNASYVITYSLPLATLRITGRKANRGAWPTGVSGQGPDLRIAIEGMWFQTSNRGAFHEVHSHGNCSWSGVYCVQVDSPARRVTHATYGASNGVTRCYGPHFQQLGGAHVDLGNAYLQPPQVELEPVPGQLLLFPSWLAHQALPYEGELDRVIVSFNASIHAAQGSDQLHRYSAG
ncbi:MAG: hypothetical protein EBY28_26345, partial [Betaproteobacteria bacterium]|nr:hypothetical protein [Betaproteobacteria bacterium]